MDFKQQLQSFLQTTLQKNYDSNEFPSVEIDSPSEKINGDYSSNIALKSAKILKKAPLAIAQEFQGVFQSALEASPLKNKIIKIEIKNPGFLNFFIAPTAILDSLDKILKEKDAYGKSKVGKGEQVQIEFVSANPTGPLSIAHARQAAVGDSLGNILNFLGFQVTKEYYINDGGNQINILGNSIKLRGKEILGEKIEFPEDYYQGEYIKDMAQEYMQKNSIKTAADFEGKNLSKYGADYLLDVIKNDLDDFGVHFDVWSRESTIADEKAIKTVLDLLKAKGFLYEKEGALWFETTKFGDDKDRVVRKSDGSYTYLTPDIAYHKNKFDRGFSKVINLWGPDHHGYVPRIKAAAEALGKDKNAINVIIVQLATIYRDGQAISMSTRRGQYISLREVIDEVGVDASRYFFMMRHTSAHLDFDLELAKKETPENPVYYIQYAHARVYSIDKKAEEASLKPTHNNFSHLKEEAELDLIKKLGAFEENLMFCLAQSDPYPLVSYLHETATCFHKFYDRCRIVDAPKEIASERLGLCHAARIVLANGLKLLGVSTPQSM